MPLLPIVPAPPPPDGGTPPPPPAPTPAPGAGRTERFDLTARANGATYPIDIYVPPAHASGDQTFPTVYITDADAVS